MPKARIPLVLGTAFIALESGGPARIVGVEAVQSFFDVFVKKYGYTSIDTARVYTDGSSEAVIGKVELGQARVDTKILPIAPGDLKADKVKATFQLSENALGSTPIRVYYLHKPDRTVPFEETLEAINELHQQGKIEQLGLSNFASWEVAEIVGICKRRGFIQPTVYQGVYSVIQRAIEPELVPCLRKFGIKFAAYSILAGGLLTGKYLTSSTPEPNSHFDLNSRYGAMYNSKYMPLLPVVKELKDVADKHSITLGQVAARWIVHHSILTPEDHGAIIGASSNEQLEQAITDCEQGPLPEEVVQACEEAWKKVQAIHSESYWF